MQYDDAINVSYLEHSFYIIGKNKGTNVHNIRLHRILGHAKSLSKIQDNDILLIKLIAFFYHQSLLLNKMKTMFSLISAHPFN